MNIIQLMTPKVSTAFLYDTDSIKHGFAVMRRHGYTAIPVLSAGGAYLGCVTEGDFRRFVMQRGSTDTNDYENDSISSLLRPDFCPSLRIQASMEDIIEVAMQQNFIPITDDRDAFCGIITRRSLLGYLSEHYSGD